MVGCNRWVWAWSTAQSHVCCGLAFAALRRPELDGCRNGNNGPLRDGQALAAKRWEWAAQPLGAVYELSLGPVLLLRLADRLLGETTPDVDHQGTGGGRGLKLRAGR